MKIKYRFLEGDINKNEGFQGVVGMAYTGYFIPLNVKPHFFTIKSLKETTLINPLETLNKDDIETYRRDLDLVWSKIFEKEITENDENFNIEDLLIERMNFWDSVKSHFEMRKAA